MTAFIAVIHKEKRSEFGVSFPDFPGCVAAGKTLEAARQDAHEALELHVDGLIDDGDELPIPSTLDEVAEHEFFGRSAAVCLVDVDDYVGTERINCTFRSDVLRRIDEAVARLGTNRSAFLASAALERLRSERK